MKVEITKIEKLSKIDLKTANELQLSFDFLQAFEKENYEKCAEIRDVINNRIEDNTINHSLVQLLKSYNPITGVFDNDGSPASMLFKNYQSN